ncbi:MAG: hypothetical protein PHS93_02315 [Candidatus Omnitrophica bacterium]|nr:hypothetical protein [Candidatus Omnitrophota bacterium]MDD5351987.1 hypothetical protein [Candidatus Omnitrophota bacterium]MDD5551041.1 hypothetical protein [Candidatus Omnitrophota bacterium]
MKKNVFIFVALLVSFCLFFSGCPYLIVGTVGALGGYAISKDTIQGDTERTFNSVWKTSLNVLAILGTIKTEDLKKGTIEAEVEASEVKLIIEQLTPRTVRMRVSARKYLMPNIKLAQKIFIKVMEQAK